MAAHSLVVFMDDSLGLSTSLLDGSLEEGKVSLAWMVKTYEDSCCTCSESGRTSS